MEWAGGTIDLLVNNAGIVVLEDFMDVTAESFDDAIAVNTRAPLLVSQVIRACRDAARSSCIRPSSTQARERCLL